MADLVDAIRVRKPNDPTELGDLYFPAVQPVSMAAAPTGAATANNQTTIIGHVDGLESGLGAAADAAASSDTGTFSLLALTKRALTNWTTLLARVPSLTVSSTRLLVDGSGVTQPVSATSLPLPSGAATAANQSTSNSSLSSIDGKTPALQSGAVPVGDNGASLTVDGRSATVTATFNRPADTTAYVANDVIGSATTANHEAANAGTSGNLMMIQSVSLTINNTSPPSGMTTFRIHIWDTAPNSLADNAAFAVVAADRSKYRGFIDLPSMAAVGGGFLHAFADYVGRPIRLTSTSFWFNVQTIGAYTPSSATEYSVRFQLIEAGA